MAKFLVKTPVPDFSGALGGVMFADGQAVVDEDTHPAELDYCRSRYVVEDYVAADADGNGAQDVMPKKSSSKADWVAFAIEHGVAAEEAESLTRDQLVELFIKKEDGQ